MAKAYDVSSPQWAKHLRKYWKRVFWKKNRKASKSILTNKED
jgi:hypothetical protein